MNTPLLKLAPFRLLAALLVLGMAVSAANAATSNSNINKSFSVKPGGQLVVDADRGSVEILTGERTDLQIDVERKISRLSKEKADEVFAAHQITFDQDGDRVEVHAKSKKDFNNWLRPGNLEVHYRIQAPKQFNFDLRTAAGSITAEDIQGKVKARTAGGSLKFANVDGTFDGATSAGSIGLSGASGTVVAKTSGGGIRLGDMGADTVAETSAGSIHVESAKAKLNAITRGGGIEIGDLHGPTQLETSAGSIHVKSAGATLSAHTSGGGIAIDNAADTVIARTSAGSIKASFSAQPSGDCNLETSGGGITVKLADKLAFDVDAKTSGGDVKTQIPITTEVVGRHRTESLKGKLNGGGKALVLRTSAGNINIEKLGD